MALPCFGSTLCRNPATMPEENIKNLGAEAPYQRPGQPKEVAAVFVFLASQESSYITSEVSIGWNINTNLKEKCVVANL
jgi:NAD(P)-dependent dehydrogenase (short-subunit alcohol dehydrogenase family)